MMYSKTNLKKGAWKTQFYLLNILKNIHHLPWWTILAEEEYITMINKLRGNFLTEKAKKTFRKWNKTMAFEFTDLEKTYYFPIEAGQPNEILEGEPEKADIKINKNFFQF